MTTCLEGVYPEARPPRRLRACAPWPPPETACWQQQSWGALQKGHGSAVSLAVEYQILSSWPEKEVQAVQVRRAALPRHRGQGGTLHDISHLEGGYLAGEGCASALRS